MSRRAFVFVRIWVETTLGPFKVQSSKCSSRLGFTDYRAAVVEFLAIFVKKKPTFIRLLGEDLVLFPDGQGRAGVVGALCSHRRAKLCLGNVEKQGLRYRYHGWLCDAGGKVLRAESHSKMKLETWSYSV